MREANEREAFSRIATAGRSARSDDALAVPAETVEGFRALVARGPQAPVSRPLEQMLAWAAPGPSKRVLEICCHDGEFGTIMARLGAEVDSVDIAPPLIASARRRAALNGVSARQRAHVMSVHDMSFPDASFDVVFGKASLHHLDLGAARAEVLRVLKPGGVAVFAEPVILSRPLRRARLLVPVPLDAESPDERPLSFDELTEFVAPFSSARWAYFRLLGRLDRVVPSLQAKLQATDRWLIEHVPGAWRAAGVCVFAVTR